MTIPYGLQSSTQTRYRVESTYGTLPANDSTARVFRGNAGDGMQVSKSEVASNEIRSDLQRTRSRHGMRSVAGELSCDLSVGTFDPLLEAACRGTFAPVLTTTSFTADLNATTGVLTRAAGGFLFDGFRIGDVVTLSGIGVNSNIPFILSAVGSNTCTIANRADIVSSVTAQAGVTMTRARKVLMPTSVVRRSFTIEHYSPEMQTSERFTGCRLTRFNLSAPTEGPVTASFAFAGQNYGLLTAQATPYFSNATTTTAPMLSSADARVFYANGIMANLVSLSMAVDLGGTPEQVAGSLITPDVVDGQASITGTIELLCSDLTANSRFIDEEAVTLAVMLREVGSAGFTSFCIPQLTLMNPTITRVGASGLIRASIGLNVGVASGAALDSTMLSICTSAAA